MLTAWWACITCTVLVQYKATVQVHRIPQQCFKFKLNVTVTNFTPFSLENTPSAPSATTTTKSPPSGDFPLYISPHLNTCALSRRVRLNDFEEAPTTRTPLINSRQGAFVPYTTIHIFYFRRVDLKRARMFVATGDADLIGYSSWIGLTQPK